MTIGFQFTLVLPSRRLYSASKLFPHSRPFADVQWFSHQKVISSLRTPWPTQLSRWMLMRWKTSMSLRSSSSYFSFGYRNHRKIVLNWTFFVKLIFVLPWKYFNEKLRELAKISAFGPTMTYRQQRLFNSYFGSDGRWLMTTLSVLKLPNRG